LALSAVQSASAAADQLGTDQSAGQAAESSAGKSGTRLKWISARPEAAAADSSVTAAQYAAPVVPRRVLRAVRGAQVPSGSLSDPFGDNCAPENMPGGTSVARMPGEPTTPAPNLSLEGPGAGGRPYYAPTPLTPDKAQNGSKPSPLSRELETLIPERQHEFNAACPSPKDLKHISELTTNIAPTAGELPHDCPLGNEVFQPRCFAPITYTWTASALCHKPLYFEDVQLERYGHMAGPWLQPVASGVNFFATIPILPYKMGLELPNECMYTLGYYRPGDCAPYLFDPIPLSVRGAFFEAGAWIGGIYAIP
jgi:hypothetical protein